MVSENLVELTARAVATAMAPMDAQLKALQTEVIAMKNLDEADGLGNIWERVRSDNPSAHPAKRRMG